jgi:N-dimethylarginine dimethylaminohydrolase
LGFGYPEYGRLRTVLMHRPDKELDAIGPKTYKRFLFSDAIDPDQFRRDHERFVEALRSEGVNVALITELLHDQPELLSETERLPNLVYTRDTVTVTSGGYILTRMKNPVRRKETTVVEAALRKLSIPPLLKTQAPATIEGGDMIFLDEETLLLGIGNRTNVRGLREVVKTGKELGLRSLIAVPLPSTVIHLDGTMMPIDRDLAIVHLRSLQTPARLFEDGRPSKKMWLTRFLRARGMNLIEVTDYERQRRATNVIPIESRKAIAYGGNARVRRELADNGVDLIEIDGAELIRGSGGPRCMTAAVLRE